MAHSTAAQHLLLEEEDEEYGSDTSANASLLSSPPSYDAQYALPQDVVRRTRNIPQPGGARPRPPSHIVERPSNARLSTLYPDGRDGVTFRDVETLQADMESVFLCSAFHDVFFLVGEGEEREVIGGVRAILASRSRIFCQMLYPQGTGGSPRMQRSATKKSFKGSKANAPATATSDPLLRVEFELTEFAPETFKLLMEYAHTGAVLLQVDTLMGLLNAADHFRFDQLRASCAEYLSRCVAIDTVIPLLQQAGYYIQYKSTKVLMKSILEFVDQRAEEVLALNEFGDLPQHVIRLILSREELQASELTKFRAVHAWVQRFVDCHEDESMSEVAGPLIDFISFHKISAAELMRDVKPSGLVPDDRIMTALAFQADPGAVDPVEVLPPRSRMTSISRRTVLNESAEGSDAVSMSAASDARADSNGNGRASSRSGRKQPPTPPTAAGRKSPSSKRQWRRKPGDDSSGAVDV